MRQQLVQGRAKRENVGAMVYHLFARRLLRTHVTQRADQVAGDGQAWVALHLGEAEIRHPQVAGPVHHDVCRLHVTVDDALLVGVMQRLGRLHRQRTAVWMGTFGEDVDAASIGPRRVLSQRPVGRLPRNDAG